MRAGVAWLGRIIRGHYGPRQFSADETVEYDFVRQGDEWKIDDIRGSSDGKPWSVREMLALSLKP